MLRCLRSVYVVILESSFLVLFAVEPFLLLPSFATTSHIINVDCLLFLLTEALTFIFHFFVGRALTLVALISSSLGFREFFYSNWTISYSPASSETVVLALLLFCEFAIWLFCSLVSCKATSLPLGAHILHDSQALSRQQHLAKCFQNSRCLFCGRPILCCELINGIN